MLNTPNANDPSKNVSAQYQGTDYKVSISGNGVNGTYNYNQYPQLTVGQTYTFTVIMPTAQKYTGTPKTVKFDGSQIELWANKNATPVTKYTVTINVTPSNATVKVDGNTYTGPIQVESGKVINVKAVASGYKDWFNSYTITSNFVDDEGNIKSLGETYTWTNDYCIRQIQGEEKRKRRRPR